VRRSTRSDESVDRPKLLDALGKCRQACIEALTTAKASGPLYHGCSMVVAAIDGLATLLTGNQYHFHLAPHGTRVGQTGTGSDGASGSGAAGS
jgi:hypothetical protein